MAAATRLCLLVALLLLGGCGGGSEQEGSSDSKDRAQGSAYSVKLPSGWKDSTEEASKEDIPVKFDRVFTADREGGFTTNVNVVRERKPQGVSLDAIKDQGRKQLQGLGASEISQQRDTKLGGEPASAVQYSIERGGKRLRGQQVVAVRDDRIFYATLSAGVDKFADAERGYQSILSSWQWR